jgi:uncharacterized protein YbjT (DUF2867 family)
MAEPAGKTALVAGGSGMVGAYLIPMLLDAGEYSRVLALSRRPLPLDHPRLANRVVRFDTPLEPQLAGNRCQDAFCCLGTTIREAGSQAAFRAVDHDLVLQVARAALSVGAERLVVISAIGAGEQSRNFYLRVKGETERALMALSVRSLDILQPSVLLGSRRELRPLELLSQGLLWAVSPLLLGNSARYRAIPAATVAAAMLGAARSGRRGVYRYTFRDMSTLAAAAKGNRARV